MLKEVDLQVVRGIVNAVNERGADWVYPVEWRDPGEGISCKNLHEDGSAACIIGFIAVDQGLPTIEGNGAADDAENWVVSDSVGSAMQAAQSAQDDRKTWGYAGGAFFSKLSWLSGMSVAELCAAAGVDRPEWV
jgi:hypothetical protein